MVECGAVPRCGAEKAVTPSPPGSTGQLDASGDIAAAAERVAAEFAARAAEADREARFPTGDLAALRASGLLGVMVPTRLGGPGAGFGDYARLAMTLAKGSGASALVFNMHASVTGALAQTPDAMVRALGAPEGYFALRDSLLSSARDGAFFAVAMSERSAGSRLSSMSTTYTRTGSGFAIRGSKAFVSGAALADGYLVAARAQGDSSRISYFLVEAGDGVVVEPTWDVLGMRGTGSDDIVLDVEVSHDALLGGVEGLGLLIARLMPHWLVASYAAVYVGVARACIDAAVEHVRNRSLDHLSAVRARIGQADAAVASAELSVLEAAARVDADPGGMDTNRAVYRAKLVAGQTAQDVAASMLEAAGTSAMRRGHPLERLYRDARCGSLQPATSDVCADWLGMFALGLDPNAAEVPRW
jgi:alkylation response protein AidB-like acyl-CoA dehydrogenase